MRDLEKYLKNKEIDYNKLTKYGFIEDNNKYTYKVKIHNDEFEVIVEISDNEKKSKIIDIFSNEEYILVDIEESTGDFVGKLREEYENILIDIFKNCTNENIFKFEQTKEIIKYIKEKYNDELEFLWEKFDNNAIWRNKINQKWYGLLLTVTKDKLKINSNINTNEIIEIIDLRYPKGENLNIVDNEKFFLGYHMNKNSWITLILDGRVETDTIKKLIDNSYNLSVGNSSTNTMDELSRRVFDYLTKIPKGKVVTYKQVAEYLGNKGLSRVVGNILHKNPDGDKYPCYKVLNSKGELAEEFVFGGKEEQKKRLEKDGIIVEKNKVNLKIYKWENE